MVGSCCRCCCCRDRSRPVPTTINLFNIQGHKFTKNRLTGKIQFYKNWKSQIVISNPEKMGIRKPPLAFTEQGVAIVIKRS